MGSALTLRRRWDVVVLHLHVFLHCCVQVNVHVRSVMSMMHIVPLVHVGVVSMAMHHRTAFCAVLAAFRFFHLVLVVEVVHVFHTLVFFVLAVFVVVHVVFALVIMSVHRVFPISVIMVVVMVVRVMVMIVVMVIMVVVMVVRVIVVIVVIHQVTVAMDMHVHGLAEHVHLLPEGRDVLLQIHYCQQKKKAA